MSVPIPVGPHLITCAVYKDTGLFAAHRIARFETTEIAIFALDQEPFRLAVRWFAPTQA